jgi:putative nucleotidyltransferase with HDIG domain
MTERMQVIEDHVVRTMATVESPDLRIAHGFPHVDRVRRWALHIAAEEGYPDLAVVEAAALLHDIGLAFVSERREHGQVGAEMAARYLREHALFSPAEVEAIAEAIRCHNAPPGGGGLLGTILREADTLDTLGAVGIMRAFTSKYALLPYDPQQVKGETWGWTIGSFEERFAAGRGIGPAIVDQINFQISLHENLQTASARRAAMPLVAYMRAFLDQLAREVTAHV